MPRIEEKQTEISAETPKLEQTDEVLASVQAKLDALDSDDTPVLEETEELQETKGETEETEVGDEPDESTEEKSDESPEEPEAETEPESKGPILPTTHRRSLAAYGWDETEIAEGFKDNPTAFAAMADKLHQRRIAETNSYAEMGRKIRAEERQTQDRPASQTSQQILPDGLQRIDTDALKKEYEGDELVHGLIDKMAGPLNGVIDTLSQLMPQITQAIHSTQETDDAAMARQLDDFFGSASMKSYADLYGSSFEGATEDQFSARYKVMEHADALLVGADRQDRKMSRADALDFAHESVSAGFKTTAIRNTIKTQIKARSKSITLKPVSKSTSSSGEKLNRQELEARVGSSLSKLFRT